MPKPTRTTDITSFSDIRQNLRTHINRVKKSGRPLFVTTNGKAEVVILSAKEYDDLRADIEFRETKASIERSFADVKARRVKSVDQAFADIRAAAGLTRKKRKAS
ncbi:MAG: type II toxin-antitoxin system Phd/YefM family antitoxin [Phycisphaerae bacterium]|jgi:prevent-host-death family protein